MLNRTKEEAGGESGLTLLEVIVAIAILGMIMLPLAAAFITAFTSSNQVKSRLDRNGDTQRVTEAWTRDVQGVDVGGLYDSDTVAANVPCQDPAPGSYTYTPLITFTSSSGVDAGAPRKSTWSVRGTSYGMELVRTVCDADLAQASSVDILADSFGKPGLGVADAVHGPNGAGSVFCTGRQCTIEISGSYNFTLTVARRVPDLSIGSGVMTVPPAPTITGVTPRDGGLAVGWLPPAMPVGTPQIDYYELDTATSAGGPWTTVTPNPTGASVGADVGGLTNGTNYWIRIRAHNSVGFGPYATAGPVQPKLGPPIGPTILIVEPADKALVGCWNPVAGATGYFLYAQEVNSGREQGPEYIPATSIATSGTCNGKVRATIPGLTNGVLYKLTVSVINDRGVGDRGPFSSEMRPYGQPPLPQSVTALAGDKTITVNFVKPSGSNDDYVNGNGRKITGARIALYRSNLPVNPDPDVSPPIGLWGYYVKTINVNDSEATWNAPSGNTLSFNLSLPAYITNGTPYRIALALQATSDVGVTEAGSVMFSVPEYNNAFNYPFVTPSGTPTAPSALRVDNLYTDGRLDLGWDEPSTTVGIDNLLNGANLTKMQAEVQTFPAGVTQTALGRVQDTTVGRPVTPAERLISGLGPLPGGGQNYKFRVRVANKGERPTDVDRWGPWSDWGAQYTVNAGPLAPTNVSLTRPAGSFGTNLNLSYSGVVGATRYEIKCRANGGVTPATISTTATSVAITGLTDGRDYSCTVQAYVALQPGGISQSNLARPYGECTLVASQDTYVDDEDGGSHAGSTNLSVGRNGEWYEFGSGSNKRALVKWDYTSACTNGSALPSTSYLTNVSWNLYLNGTTNRTHRLNLATTSWNEAATWGSNVGIGTSPGSWWAGNGGWKTFDITTLARSQKATPATNYGWVVRDDGGDAYYYTGNYSSRENGSNKPYLGIQFYTQGP